MARRVLKPANSEPAPANTEPTLTTYAALNVAAKFLNEKLFGGRLPPHCLLTLQRRAKTRGFFSNNRFESRDGEETVHEIGLNPQFFRGRSDEEILSVLAHELVHFEQQEYGRPSLGRYHNAEWAVLMRRIGLEPSSTGEPGGKPTGQKVSHYILSDGPFARAAAELLATGFCIRYIDREDEERRTRKAASKTRYTCPSCGLHAWAKPDTLLTCTACLAIGADSTMMARKSAT